MKSKTHRKQKPQPPEKKPFFSTPHKVQSKEKDAFFQPKLNISKANDPLEKEADAVASRIVDKPKIQNGQTAEVQRKEMISRQGEEEEPQAKLEVQRQAEEEEPQAKLEVQRQAEEEEAQAKLEVQRQAEEEEPQAKLEVQRQAEEEEPQAKLEVQRQAEEEEPQAKLEVQRQAEEEEPQAKTDPNLITAKKGQSSTKEKKKDSAPTFEQQLQKSKGKGIALPDDIKMQMESEFGANFSPVRIHIGKKAAQLCQMIGAQAFTHGYDIYFNTGKYQPQSKSGKELLAHELTHVVQQKGSKV